MRLIVILCFIWAPFSAFAANDYHRIYPGSNGAGQSISDLQRRVYDLEIAVSELQRKIYQIESGNVERESWVCTIRPFSRVYTGTGASKAVATMRAIEACKKGESDQFFCKNPECEE